MSVNVTGSTKIMGLLGHNISYSLSPLIHNYSIKALDLNYVYTPFDLSPQASLEAFLATLWDLGSPGFNVTVPYKYPIGKLVANDCHSSVNTLFRGPLGWESASTDGQGFVEGVRRLGVSFSGFKDIVFLGNGGAVLGILEFLTSFFETAPNIHVLRRNKTRDNHFRSAVPHGYPIGFYSFEPEELSKLIGNRGGETLVVQATSAPSVGDPLSEFAPAMAAFSGVFVDLTYGSFSGLLAAAEHRGIPCQDGLSMLVEQARLSQKLWWGDSLGSDALHSLLQQRGFDR